jgi:hypothetical protein
MAEYFDKYKRRLKRNGNDIGEVYKNNTIAFIEATFHASPTFRVMGVKSSKNPEITEMDARVVEVERLGTLREVILRPNQDLDIGTYVTFDGETWIVFDKHGSAGAGKSVKLVVEKCNRTIKWRDKDGNVIEHDCVASSMDLGSKAKQGKNEIEWNKYDVRLPLGQLFVFVETNADTSTIKLNDRFIFGRNVYEVVGIDDTTTVGKDGYGIIQLTIKVATIRAEDDFTNRIAYNSYTVEETTTPTDNANNSGDGGTLW